MVAAMAYHLDRAVALFRSSKSAALRLVHVLREAASVGCHLWHGVAWCAVGHDAG
jgi:hypothetical protein